MFYLTGSVNYWEKSCLAGGLLASEEGLQFIEVVKCVCVVYMNLHLVKKGISKGTFVTQMRELSLFQWLRFLRRRSVAARLVTSWVRIPPGAWMSFCCECRLLSSRGLLDELITRPEESYRLCYVVVFLS